MVIVALGEWGCAGGSTPVDCQDPGQVACGDSCTDPQSDPKHCGGCDQACEPGQLCCEGGCVPETEESCGTCGNACDKGSFCQAGSCELCAQDHHCGPSCLECAEPTPFCLDGRCAECKKDDQCDKGSFCKDGSCSPCVEDDHCGPTCKSCDSTTYCNADAQDCVTCSGHGDCPLGKYCNGTACRDCSTNEFCGVNCVQCTGTAKPYCNAAGTACALCANDTHCRTGQYCASAGVCEACTSVEHCGPLCESCAGASPFCSPTGCAECLNETHCGPGFRCINGACIPCYTDEHCGPSCSNCTGGPSPYCADSAAFCVQCKIDGHCAEGKYCNSGGCAACAVDDHCGVACVQCEGATPHCNAAGTSCVVCLTDSHCGGGTFCQGGSCVACNTDDHCGASCGDCPFDEFCNGASCVGCCGVACNICLPGQYCKGESCVACDTDDHCGPTCVACGGGTPHCKGGASCVECVTSGDCPTGSYCTGDKCEPCSIAAKCGPTCAACSVAESCCGAAAGCADLNSDQLNCGACGKACSTFCNNGLCDASIKCSVNLGEDIYSTPAVDSQGNVYVTTTAGRLRRISPICVVDWTYTKGNFTDSSAVLSPDEQTVYFATAAGPAKVLAVDAASGGLVWDYEISNGWSSYNTPAVASDGTVYAIGNVYTSGDYREIVHALSPAGVLKWTYNLGGTGNKQTGGPAIAADGTIFALTTAGELHAVSPAGSKKWSKVLGGSVSDFNPAIGSDGHVYAGTSSKSLFKLDQGNGDTLWSKALATSLSHIGPVATSDGRVYIALSDGRIRAYQSDGSALWTVGPSGCYHNSAAVGSDGVIYAANGCNGALVALSPVDGATLWSLQIADAFASSPSLSADGILWVGANKTLWAVATGAVTGLAGGGWPKRHANRRNSGRR